MSTNNSSRHETAFTVSIEAREGVSTGISAHDRARTVAVAIDPGKTAADIATPGHVFPLRARTGGVLVRAGIPRPRSTSRGSRGSTPRA
jgi:3,4-dihydroxy 2-butanone 4-phosphate synthase / GTP cyclohydrolase II